MLIPPNANLEQIKSRDGSIEAWKKLSKIVPHFSLKHDSCVGCTLKIDIESVRMRLLTFNRMSFWAITRFNDVLFDGREIPQKFKLQDKIV